jgi:hypothetical protein
MLATLPNIIEAARTGALRPMKPRTVVVLLTVAAAQARHAKIDAIAHAAGLSTSTTKRAIADLRAAGWTIERGY